VSFSVQRKFGVEDATGTFSVDPCNRYETSADAVRVLWESAWHDTLSSFPSGRIALHRVHLLALYTFAIELLCPLCATMVGQNRNNAPRLLKMVGGKPHASEDDHEESEPAPKRRRTDAAPAKKAQEMEDVNAEPQSSDDELGLPPPRPAESSKPTMPRRNSMEGLALKKTKTAQRTSSRNRAAMRAPARGAYQTGLEHKGRGATEDKENSTSTQSSVGSAEDGGFQFDPMAYPTSNSNKQKTTYKTANIHASVPKASNGPAKKNYGAGNSARNKQPPSGTGNDSELSDPMSGEELDDVLKDMPGPDRTEDPDLPRPPPKVKHSATKASNSKLAPLDDGELSDTLQPDVVDPLARTTKKASNSARTLYQLNKWKEDQELPSSQPQSSAPQEDLDDVSSYVKALPVREEEGSRCTVCSKPVDQEDYWDFWKGKKKTVKNKAAFCNAHKKISAQKEYTQTGYPPIDWSALTIRLRKHKTRLSHLLDNTGKRPSIHRNRYEPLALTGKAAAVPSKRTDLSKDQLEELNSFALDEPAAFPGYYGPHGRRVIIENVMEILKTEIKDCRDNVVQGSGIASFVQAVMVPEAAVLLIMEDCGVEWEEAESIREKTYEMGMLLNEEIEDELERRPEDDSDAENEYRR
jgi:hypothetical protein